LRAAAWVVAWALLPGAIAVARRVPAGPETDALVASQLCKNSKPRHGEAGACRWLKAEYGGVAMVPTDE
jgi:hypothetical protein